MTREQITEAKIRRARGASYRAIGDALGASATTVARNISPAARHRQRARDRDRYPLRRAVPRERLRQRLASLNYMSRRNGYAPCSATVAELIQAETGGCHICRGKGDRRGLFIDHDHTTGEFRGWLCKRCNSALGYLADSSERLRAAIHYVQPEPDWGLAGATF